MYMCHGIFPHTFPLIIYIYASAHITSPSKCAFISLHSCTYSCPFMPPIFLYSDTTICLFLYIYVLQYSYVSILSTHTHIPYSCACTYSCPFIGTSFFMFIYIYRPMYVCSNYPILTTYHMYAPIKIRICVPITWRFAQCIHTCDPMFKDLYFNILICLYFLSIRAYHVRIKLLNFVCSSLSHLCVLQHCHYLYPLYSPQYVLMFLYLHQDCFKWKTKNTCKQFNIHIYRYIYIHIYI